MRAVIHQVAGRQGVSALPIAGRPLIVRQVQWLRAIGCERIALEIDSHPSTERIVDWLAADGCGLFVDVVLTPRPMGAREVARRAGVPNGDPFFAVPADVLGAGDFSTLAVHGEAAGVEIELEAPAGDRRMAGGRITLYGRISGARPTVRGAGWGARITTFRDAHELGLSALSGALGGAGSVFDIPIHAAEVRPGVWIARGADVSDAAELVAPVLVGSGVYVAAGARVGPRAVIGDRAVIEADAVVEDGYVAEGLVVEDARVLRDTNLTEGGVRALTIPPCTSLVPGAGTVDAARPSMPERALAAFALICVAPVAGAARVVMGPRASAFALGARLVAVVAGRMRLFGVGARLGGTLGASPALLRDAGAAPRGAIDVEPALSESDADDLDRLRARAWYASAKSFRLDVSLARRAAFVRRRAAESEERVPRRLA